ncbi:PfaD family polyunsaturated fatty acid/polyketide biosynthesis protein [Coleofasciculus sp. FACHB-64]|uniref:PfaD family polyunsaturated fatty acid/polyketide biosynthesis protein n=1 Tax=Cyanophyceae TaxID=3028117 RepID=UPI001681C421|nr:MULTISPECIES: PfaD family polyunsaturated fatty acid/polyketide biosynthesis protein [unclassified Coleofasciculus]MBD1839013.1 PfaD family polyunsaturated fatty acid/polyketide biosynthesis protein [Coleofasciculus sp. FACHB-501]MBD2048431.1 PfaD family polyunsaturated fatty acid/polyketide biosynthesis protein [Coleofasciculus sp. FACHB-64]
MLAIPLTQNKNGLRFSGNPNNQNPVWQGSLNSVAFDEEGIKTKLLNLDKPCYIVSKQGQIGVTNEGYLGDANNGKTESVETLTAVPPLVPQQLGDPSFLTFHGVKYAYSTGSMANGIASEEMVIALGKEKILSAFGAAGLVPSRIETAIHRIQQALPEGPYAFNLIHSPSEAAIERGAINLYLKYGVTTVEASAFLDLTPNIVYYRAAGLSLNSANQIEIKNKIIAKVSRAEVATKFLQPAPTKMLKQLVAQGLITELQASLAEKIPMADDITVEADSGGHTDNRPLVCLLPSILTLRDEIQEKYGYEQPVRVGAAGGIGTPQSALGAFMMGAAYVVTGSINQSCLEAGASTHTKNLLAQAAMADVSMAPAADMFEMGVKLQVLKRGSLFPMRAQKLFDFYKNYDSIEEIPLVEREKLEKEIFRKSLESVWEDTVAYFSQRDPDQITRADNNPKRKMALIFRSYLGLSSRWSNAGEKGREMDYQIWCGPSMGSFNEWVKGSYLAQANNRRVVDVADHIMIGSAFLYRLQNLKLQGLSIPAQYWNYCPKPLF